MSAQPFVYIAPALLVILLLLAMQYDHHQAAVAKVHDDPLITVILAEEFMHEDCLELQEGKTQFSFDTRRLNAEGVPDQWEKNGSGSFESIDLTDTDSPAPAKKVRFLASSETASLSMEGSHDGSPTPTISVGY